MDSARPHWRVSARAAINTRGFKDSVPLPEYPGSGAINIAAYCRRWRDLFLVNSRRGLKFVAYRAPLPIFRRYIARTLIRKREERRI